MRPLLIAAAVLLGSTAIASAATVTLEGRIRDFNDTHPDFESWGGAVTGAVKNDLGADGKPVWNNPSAAPFSNEANFNQWYRDVSGVNLGRDFQLTLDDSVTPGRYRYSNNAFFPIDGELLGNQGRWHNYHFTLELAGKFSFEDGQSFTFAGDDDLWIFFGGKLGIDLGGVHASLTQTITSEGLKALGLSTGTAYDLNIFFAERHTGDSNFTIETSFAVTPPDPAPVPLPAGFPLLAAGIGGLALLRRRKA